MHLTRFILTAYTLMSADMPSRGSGDLNSFLLCWNLAAPSLCSIQTALGATLEPGYAIVPHSGTIDLVRSRNTTETQHFVEDTNDLKSDRSSFSSMLDSSQVLSAKNFRREREMNT